MGDLVKMRSTRAIKARAKAVAAEARVQAEASADLEEAKPYKEWTPYDLCCEAREIAEALQHLAYDGKIDYSYGWGFFTLCDQFDTLCNHFCADDGWENFDHPRALDCLERERERLETRIKQINDKVADLENNQPAS